MFHFCRFSDPLGRPRYIYIYIYNTKEASKPTDCSLVLNSCFESFGHDVIGNRWADTNVLKFMRPHHNTATRMDYQGVPTVPGASYLRHESFSMVHLHACICHSASHSENTISSSNLSCALVLGQSQRVACNSRHWTKASGQERGRDTPYLNK